MAKLSVEIVTPERRVLSVQAEEAVVPGYHGLFGVRPGHTPFLSLMEPGTLTLRDGGSSQSFFVSGGFAEVSRDKVLVLAESAEPISAIDVAAAKSRLEEAQKKLKGLAAEDARFEVETAAVKREAARIAAAGRR
ncbi:MAG: F0F1 ATP synthase subunit epsilon [Myxococcales bacterium]|nr:F0F1 ATP synthase subunit epsilon [Myxococcales bacterium]